MSKFNEIEPLSDEDLAYYIAVSEEGGPAGSGRNTIGYKMAVELRHLRALGKSAVPEGYVLVPREPTVEMKMAGCYSNVGDSREAIYRAMLAAAPKEQGHE